MLGLLFFSSFLMCAFLSTISDVHRNIPSTCRNNIYKKLSELQILKGVLGIIHRFFPNLSLKNVVTLTRTVLSIWF